MIETFELQLRPPLHFESFVLLDDFFAKEVSPSDNVVPSVEDDPNRQRQTPPSRCYSTFPALRRLAYYMTELTPEQLADLKSVIEQSAPRLKKRGILEFHNAVSRTPPVLCRGLRLMFVVRF